MPTVRDNIKIVTTPQLMTLIDDSERAHAQYQLPDALIRRLDATGRHALQAHSLYQLESADFIRARGMFRLLGEPVASGIYLLDVAKTTWQALPDRSTEVRDR
jgi:hypothetical protein